MAFEILGRISSPPCVRHRFRELVVVTTIYLGCLFIERLPPSQVQPVITSVYSHNFQQAKQGKANVKEARHYLFKFMPLAGTTFATANQFNPVTLSDISRSQVHSPKRWMLQFHPSHVLWLAGGVCFCSGCGSINSTPRKTLLSEECIPVSEDNPKIKKIQHLLTEGSLQNTHFSSWPIGLSASQKIIPVRFFLIELHPFIMRC